MSELVREIVEADLPVVNELLKKAGRGSYVKIERLGGMTNHSYKVTVADGEELLVRIPGEGTEEMIVRSDEQKSTELACKLGIDAELYYFDNEGHKVMHFIHDPQPMNEEVMRRPENLLQAAKIFHKLHTCGVDTGVRFEVFEMAALYEKIIREGGVAFYDDYEEVKKTVMDIKAAVDKNGEAPKVPCHNDSLMGNWVLDGDGKLYLIDWEYSGMNEAMWDLSCLSIEADYSPSDDDALLKAYYGCEGREPGLDEKKYFIAAKMYVDYLWTLWGLTRVPFDGDFMQEYADNRYARLKKNIDAYKKLEG
ncbi:MAG: phosphotransferase family protein [Anaerolineaceae bacterium]|nr:phosphotransferase family protein [Anaerolineaceae bacterium]